MKKDKYLIIKKAKENNLKSISVQIPREKLVVFTGVSGSGKSSLVFDTIFKEGQRRYIASLSSYARQFMQQMEKPEVDVIDGLSPTICIDQKTAGRNPRSTVGTITEIYDFLRLLFSRLGEPHCPNGHGSIGGQSSETIISHIHRDFDSQNILVMSPIVRDRKGEYRKELKDLREMGFKRVYIDNHIFSLKDKIELKRYEKHSIDLVLDYFFLDEENASRLDESIYKSIEMSNGWVSIVQYNPSNSDNQTQQKVLNYTVYGTKTTCGECGFSLPELEPRLFSFNSRQGMCESCLGLGHQAIFDEKKIIVNESVLIFEAFSILNEEGNLPYLKKGRKEIEKIAKKWKVSLKQPWNKLPKNFRDRILYQTEHSKDNVKFAVIPILEDFYRTYHPPFFQKYMILSNCPACEGNRLNQTALNVIFHKRNIASFVNDSIENNKSFFANLILSKEEENVGTPIIKEIRERLYFLSEIGLDYLTLNRRANTLSGGEAQRIRLASQVGVGMEGCLYIMDEPSIGLHQSDNKKLIQALRSLCEKSNSVYVVEHDEDTILSADFLVDIGPYAGKQGGNILFADNPCQFSLSNTAQKVTSPTFQYLIGEKLSPLASNRTIDKNKVIQLRGIKKNNLNDVDIDIPLGVFNVVTGVSGSGKSTLILDVLKNHLQLEIQDNLSTLDDETEEEVSLNDTQFEGTVKSTDKIDRIIEITQKPIGRTSRSNPITYTKAFDVIRDLFAMTSEARYRQYTKSRFSFNVKGGRCETCKGAGVVNIDTQLFAMTEVICESCNGKRFNRSTLDIHYREKNIFDVLSMTVSEAYAFFENIPKLKVILGIMQDIGLGYLPIGITSTKISGGEAQRIKIARELGKQPHIAKEKRFSHTLYLLDEPTTGLHFHDIHKLIHSLEQLVKQGHTLVIIEHNLDLIKSADQIIEMGPKGGKEGGKILFCGTVNELCETKFPTGIELQNYLNKYQKKQRGHYIKSENIASLFFNHQMPSMINGVSKTNVTEKIAQQSVFDSKKIIIENLQKNNLNNIEINIPKNQLIAVTGVSGSGKSSLAFDTIFQEGQRKYIESLSTYARRFLGRIPRVKADKISGISPTIAVDQKNISQNPRSIIATYTEIYDSLRVIFTYIADVHHPKNQ